MITRCEFYFDRNAFHYIGLCDEFEEVEVFCEPPKYLLKIGSDNEYHFQKRNEEDLRMEIEQLKLELAACMAVANGEKMLPVGGPAFLAVCNLREQYERATMK